MKKDQERIIHISNFLTDIIGRLKLNKKEGNYTISNKACIIINLEKDNKILIN